MKMKGKGVYLWNTLKIIKERYNGNEVDLILDLKEAGVTVVAVKIVNGAYIWGGLDNFFKLLRAHGISAGAWGYSYLNKKFGNSTLDEAKAVVKSIIRYRPDFYLLDVEGEIRYQFIAAKVFADYLKKHVPEDIPIGLNSYAIPSFQPLFMYPWRQIASCCDFNCPQVYWRSSDPIERLERAQREYKDLLPNLPMSMVAGEMYFSHGIKSLAVDVKRFIKHSREDSTIEAVLMWSFVQKFTQPHLWRAFSEIEWPVDEVISPPSLPEPDSLLKQIISKLEQILSESADCKTALPSVISQLKTLEMPGIEAEPLYSAVVATRYGARLNVRSLPSLSGARVGQFEQGMRLEIWRERHADGYKWLKVSEDQDLWVAGSFVKKL